MAATVVVKELNGAGPDATTVTAIRFCTKDMYNPALTYPIPIGVSGLVYSYWKTICLDLSGDFTKINNVRFYSDSAIGWACGTGGGLFICTKSTGDKGVPEADYAQATGTEGVTGDDMNDDTDGHPYYFAGTDDHADPVSIATLTSGSPMTVDSTDHEAAEMTKGVVLQVRVDDDATQGDQADETLTWKYDEI
jgi:hypothetical protein